MSTFDILFPNPLAKTTYSVLTAYDQQCCRDAVLYDNPLALQHLAELPDVKAVAAGYLVLRFVEIEQRFDDLQAAVEVRCDVCGAPVTGGDLCDGCLDRAWDAKVAADEARFEESYDAAHPGQDPVVWAA